MILYPEVFCFCLQLGVSSYILGVSSSSHSSEYDTIKYIIILPQEGIQRPLRFIWLLIENKVRFEIDSLHTKQFFTQGKARATVFPARGNKRME